MYIIVEHMFLIYKLSYKIYPPLGFMQDQIFASHTFLKTTFELLQTGQLGGPLFLPYEPVDTEKIKL